MHNIGVANTAVPIFFVLCFVPHGRCISEVATRSGKVRGFEESTFIGKSVNTFLGIPYGAPTGGENRFGPPREVEPWEGTLDATRMPKPCYQAIEKEFKNNVIASSEDETEDCLKLNIWAPLKLPPSGKSAVLVWIHGGGFTFGSSHLPIYNGAVIAAQEDLVVVSMNYRLSGFGFLYLNHPLAPGNVGLMDQALALRWVKANIEAFGGDPERVTIFGESAGGAAVGSHLLAPTSLDLFNNAILQSGTASDMWALTSPEKALKQSVLLAEKAGCPTHVDNKEETIRCLQNVNAESLWPLMLNDNDALSVLTFTPVVDGNFLPGHPLDLFSKGRFCQEKNVLLGFTKEDGSFVLPMLAPQLDLTEDSEYTEEQIRHVMFSTSKYNDELTDLQLSLVEHMYTDWNSTPQDRIPARQQLIHFLTDRWFGCSSIEFANGMANRGNKVFVYRFDHVLQNQTGFLKLPSWMGSSHGDEFPFVFGEALRNKHGEEASLARKVMRYWANFARQGNPNDGYLQEWPMYTNETKLRLLIDSKILTAAKTDRLKECAFWREIFPKTESQMKTELKK